MADRSIPRWADTQYIVFMSVSDSFARFTRNSLSIFMTCEKKNKTNKFTRINYVQVRND